MTRPEDPNPYRKLPEPIKPEDMVESVDIEIVSPEKADDLRENEWMLRTAGG